MSKGTHVIIPLVDTLENKQWGAKIEEQKNNKVKLSVKSTANAAIGLYGLTVTTSSLKNETPNIYTSGKNIIVLFNPWCAGEMVNGIKVLSSANVYVSCPCPTRIMRTTLPRSSTARDNLSSTLLNCVSSFLNKTPPPSFDAQAEMTSTQTFTAEPSPPPDPPASFCSYFSEIFNEE